MLNGPIANITVCNPTEKKFKFKVVNLPYNADLESAINSLGLEGWKLVEVITNPNGTPPTGPLQSGFVLFFQMEI